MTVAAVVLAAGSSRRMGAVNKLTIEIGGRPLIARTVDALAAGGAAPIVVVTGHQGDQVAAALAGLEIERVDNPRHAAGVGTSIAAGARALGDRVSGLLVALGDMPRVAPATVAALIAAHRADPEIAVAPIYRGRRGHPVLFPASALAALVSLEGDRGARDVFAALRRQTIAVTDSGVLWDLDTPGQLDRD